MTSNDYFDAIHVHIPSQKYYLHSIKRQNLRPNILRFIRYWIIMSSFK